MFAEALLLGAAVWFLTTVIVEGEITKECREWIEKRAPKKVGYLVHCHMCAGTWIGLMFGFAFPLALGRPYVIRALATGLIYKGVAHLILAANNFLERCAR